MHFLTRKRTILSTNLFVQIAKKRLVLQMQRIACLIAWTDIEQHYLLSLHVAMESVTEFVLNASANFVPLKGNSYLFGDRIANKIEKLRKF